MSDPTIRPAVNADIPALHGLIESAYRGESSRRGWTTEADLLDGQRTDPEALAAILAAPGQTMLLAERDGVLVGCVLAASPRDGVGYLGMLSVDPERQAGGIGRRLVRAAEAEVQRTWGARAMEMTVFWQRSELIAWYERLGYRRTGEERPFDMADPRLGLAKRPDLHFVVLARDLEPQSTSTQPSPR